MDHAQIRDAGASAPVMPQRDRAGRLVFPALRWSNDTGFDHERSAIDVALDTGVGGFVVFGGEAGAVRDLTAELRRRARRPLLIAADLERGAGQQFAGATQLPPAGALGALDDTEVTRRAGELTGRESLALGVNWVYAPVADLDIEPLNPIVGSRSFGADADQVARHVAAWVRGCVAAGAIGCVKHFPGHGRTIHDSHAELPTVHASVHELALDRRPFAAGLAAGAATVMSAHVAFPALDDSGVPATRSRPIVAGLLRRDMGFAGLIVTDALIMEGALQDGGEISAALAAVRAGCDALLYPRDPAAVARAFQSASDEVLPSLRLSDAIERVEAFAARTPAGGSGVWGSHDDDEWAVEIGARSIRIVRDAAERARSRLDTGSHGPAPDPLPIAGEPFDLVIVDDDLGGPYAPPSREPFAAALRSAGFEPIPAAEPSGERPVVLAVYADIRGWKGRPGLSREARERSDRIAALRTPAATIAFAHPRVAPDLPGGLLLAAWGGEAVMQRAAARRLGQIRTRGR